MTNWRSYWNNMKRRYLKYNTKDFIRNVGRKPDRDDLDRCNCDKAGEVSHRNCGICTEHNLPMFECSVCGPKVFNRIPPERL